MTVVDNCKSRIQEVAELIDFSPSLPGVALNLPSETQLWKKYRCQSTELQWSALL